MRPTDKNLKPPRTTEEARERGRKGGIKSGEARRAKAKVVRSFREIAQDALDEDAREKIVKALLTYAERGSIPHVDRLIDMAQESTGASVEVTFTEGDEYGE